MKKLSFLFAAALLLASAATAQVITPNKFGIGLEGGLSSQNLSAKYFVTDKIGAELLFGLNTYSPGGDAAPGQTKVTGTDVRIGLGCFYHFSQSEFSPFAGIEAMYQTHKSGGFYAVEPDAKNAISANVVAGGEYFPAKHFSVGLKAKFGFESQLSRDIPKEETDTYLNTATTFTVKYYFN